MNETLNNIMKFINDNTYLLIGICVFLILVLIGYLIDNSVKSKKVRKDVKNETMAKEAQSNSVVNNISIDKKEDIMTKPFEEETENLIIDDNINKVNPSVTNETVNPTSNEITEPINFNFDLDSIKTKQENVEPKTEEPKSLNNSLVNDNGEINEPISVDLDTKNESANNVEKTDALSNDSSIIGINDLNSADKVSTNNEVSIEGPKADNTNIPDEITGPINFNFDLNSINTKKDEKVSDLSSNLIEPVPVIEPKDPDAEIMKNSGNNTYSNSKSLLEILSDVDKAKPSADVKMDNKEETENIFSNKPNIEIDTSVQKERVEIEPKYSSDDELDKIMKKLSSMNNDEEDNYTNIF
jgi:hypothetical protein